MHEFGIVFKIIMLLSKAAVIFIVLQRYFVRGIVLSGLKGYRGSRCRTGDGQQAGRQTEWVSRSK